MVVPKWETLLRQWYGVTLPNDYLTFDTETTGFRKTTDHSKGHGSDLPIDFGWRLVRDRKIVSQGFFLLDWTRYPQYVEREWLDDELTRVGRQMAKAGKCWNYTTGRLAAEGADPLWVLDFISELFAANRASGSRFVGHNALAFDAQLLSTVLQEFVGREWEFRDGELLDSGSLEKILGCFYLADPQQRLWPRDNEPLGAFLRRVAATCRKGVKWNIEDCVDRYNLCDLYGLKRQALHGADADSHVCHLLLEANRE